MLEVSGLNVALRRRLIVAAAAMPALVNVAAHASAVMPASHVAMTQTRDAATRTDALASKAAPVVVAERSTSSDPTFGPDYIHSYSPR